MVDSYIPDWAPFHSEPDGFRVWEAAWGRFICASPTATTYSGDLTGIARFIERERAKIKRG